MRQTELGAALQLPQQYASLDAGGLREWRCFYLAPQPRERLVHSGHLGNICQIGHTCKRRSTLVVRVYNWNNKTADPKLCYFATLSLGGNFTPLVFAISAAIHSRRSKRSCARVWAHRVSSASRSF